MAYGDSDHNSYLARSASVRASILGEHSDAYLGRYVHLWDPEQQRQWHSPAEQALRQQAREQIQANLDAYERGEFPGDQSLRKGVIGGLGLASALP